MTKSSLQILTLPLTMKLLHTLWIVIFGMCLSAVADWIQPPLKTDAGYPVPTPDFTPQIPSAHGAHLGYSVEWWYWVGHLEAVDGRQFGFQSTVFRLEGAAKDIQPLLASAPFDNQQLFMAHLALSDLNSGTYTHAERVYRGGWQAQASTETLDLKVGPIIAHWDESTNSIEKKLALPEEHQLELRLKPLKPLVVFGERGLSRKGDEPAAVSWYWTYPRLEISGTLIEGKQRTEVSGIGWMDHEIASNHLASDLAGWDWTAIQLDDGTEVKAYRLRTKAGEANPWSNLYWIDAKGNTTHAYAKDFTWETGKLWKSNLTGNRYPTDVTIRAVHPKKGDEVVYSLKPLLPDQEFVGNQDSTTYWEGACTVFDEDRKRIGKAYLELAGYSQKEQKEL